MHPVLTQHPVPNATELDPGALPGLVADLSPAYFAMVMATGIVSLSGHMLGIMSLSVVLLWLNVAAYGTIWVLTLLRIRWFTRRVLSDLMDHQRGPGFFTAVAASCILGSQFLLIGGNYRVAVLLWVAGIGLWVLLIYTILTAFTIKEDKPALYEGITGAWLLAVVATQSVAGLSALIAVHWSQPYA